MLNIDTGYKHIRKKIAVAANALIDIAGTK